VRTSRNPGAIDRARAELTRDAARSNRIIAAAAGVDSTTVQRARRQLEAAGQIPLTPQRVTRPAGRRPPLARSAIAVLGVNATPRQVADLAGISIQAAWKALRDLRDRSARLPAQLQHGTCVTEPRDRRHLWDSGSPEHQRTAVQLCAGSCPVLNECLIWSAALPDDDTATYGGLTHGQRLRIKRAAAARSPWQAARMRDTAAS
jgi:hypothetical protein